MCTTISSVCGCMHMCVHVYVCSRGCTSLETKSFLFELFSHTKSQMVISDGVIQHSWSWFKTMDYECITNMARSWKYVRFFSSTERRPLQHLPYKPVPGWEKLGVPHHPVG